jgi:hypothetical protein
VPGIEPGTSESVARKYAHYITEADLICVHHDLNVLLGNKVGKEEAVILALDVDNNRVILSHCNSYINYEEPRAMTKDFISCDFTPRISRNYNVHVHTSLLLPYLSVMVEEGKERRQEVRKENKSILDT